ncbi:MAG: hypothetical protein NTU57_04100 [Candidatus Aenigmarchaeota archaeon]|nr:hypothetical protein [Candidatus Aenigmarchaeota archaeon]
MKREPVVRRRKGQMLVFEQVLMFTIGVTIMIMAFALFTMYQNYYTSSTASDQMTEVKEYVLSSIIKACENRDANVTMILTIPKTVSNSFYKISLSNAGLNVTLEPSSGSGDFSPLYGLNETFVFSGMAISDLGKVVVYKNGNLVSLDRRVV